MIYSRYHLGQRILFNVGIGRDELPDEVKAFTGVITGLKVLDPYPETTHQIEINILLDDHPELVGDARYREGINEADHRLDVLSANDEPIALSDEERKRLLGDLQKAYDAIVDAVYLPQGHNTDARARNPNLTREDHQNFIAHAFGIVCDIDEMQNVDI